MNWKLEGFMADENISSEVIQYLKQSGFNIVDVFEVALAGKDDRLILDAAKHANRILISHDMDFGQIIFTEKVPFKGVIYLQPGHIVPKLTIETLQAIFESNIEVVEPFILVAERKETNIKLRIRNAIVH